MNNVLLEKIDMYLEEGLTLSKGLFDIEPSTKAVKDAKKIEKRMDTEDLSDLMDEFASLKIFRSWNGVTKHKRGILAYLLKKDLITKDQAMKLR